MTARIRHFALAGFALVATAISAPQANAQSSDQSGLRSVTSGPTIERAMVGARADARDATLRDDAEAALQQRLGLGQARALMIVGFAAVVVGLLVEGDVGTLIAIVGAGVGLYGLYHYLK